MSLPPTIGDYAILLKSGIHWFTALFFNFCCSLTSVFGFFIGVAISAYSDQANGWILSLAAGLFIYIALVDLVSLGCAFQYPCGINFHDLVVLLHVVFNVVCPWIQLPEIVHGEGHSHGDDDHHKADQLTDSGHHWW